MKSLLIASATSLILFGCTPPVEEIQRPAFKAEVLQSDCSPETTWNSQKCKGIASRGELEYKFTILWETVSTGDFIACGIGATYCVLIPKT